MQPSTQTLYDYFCAFAAERPNDVFIFSEHQSYTFSQALSYISGVAAQLNSCGIDARSQVHVSATRTVQTVLNFYALQFVGATAVLHDPHEQLPAGAAITLKDGVLTIGGVATQICPVQGDFTPAADSRQPTIVIFTSGSTGAPKRVALSQYNFINNSLDTAYIGGYFPDDINIDIVPIHHVFGLALIFTAVVTRHAIFVPQSVQPQYIVDSIIKYRATRLNGVPPLYLAMSACPNAADITTLRCGLIGGAPCTAEQFAHIERSLGITLVPVYGMSECVGISCGSYKDSAADRRGSVGRVYSMNSVRFAPDGEILVSSPAIAPGERPADGWLPTGDLGYLDANGYLHVSGRKKDIIIRNGNNLSAAAIQADLLKLGCINDVCVVGIPDGAEGEVPAALIVAAGDEDGVIRAIRSALVKNCIPKIIKFAPSIPLTPSGKHDKVGVRGIILSHTQAAI